MDPRASSVSRPPEWKPLVSPRQWVILAHAFRQAPEVLGDLRVVLEQLSPRVRQALLGNLIEALASDVRPGRAVWMALAVTGRELMQCSAAALGRLHAAGDQLPVAEVAHLRPDE
jgi:hypothetical protein